MRHFEDVLMYLAIICTLASYIPVILKVKNNGLTMHLILSLAFISVLTVSQMLGLVLRYPPSNTFDNYWLVTATSWIVLLLTLWNRIYLIRMIDLMNFEFHQAKVLYLLSILWHLITGMPLYVWASLIRTEKEWWLLSFGSGWILSIPLGDIGLCTYLSLSLYHRSKKLTWFSQEKVSNLKKKLVILGLFIFILVLVDISALTALGISIFTPHLNYSRIAIYMLPIHFFIQSLFLTMAMKLSVQPIQPSANRRLGEDTLNIISLY